MSIAPDLKEHLFTVYSTYNERPKSLLDPVRFTHAYTEPLAIERAGLVASSLAYGRVGQIIKSVSRVLDAVSAIPQEDASFGSLAQVLDGFKHRFTGSEEVASLLVAAHRMSETYGSLGNGFLAHYNPDDDTILPALFGFVDKLISFAPCEMPSLLPCPQKGSALKRLNLYLRWMVRKDEIDSGIWKEIPSSKLIIPLDTHMHRIGLSFGFTTRKQADMKTAIEITKGFRAFCPEDPVKFDFGLTHSSIAGSLTTS